MFDKFEPFIALDAIDFTFYPTRFEMWIGGKMVQNGSIISMIQAEVITENGGEKMKVTFYSEQLNDELAQENIFDLFLTGDDRLRIVTIPKETNVQNIGINTIKKYIGTTRDCKNFENSEPYCCNLFLINKMIAKITFSYSNPEKLLEFYNDKIIKDHKIKEEYNKRMADMFQKF